MFIPLTEIKKCRNEHTPQECCHISFCGSFGSDPTVFIMDCTNAIYAYDLKLKELYQLIVWQECLSINSMICDRDNNLYLLTSIDIRRISRTRRTEDPMKWLHQRVVLRLSMERPWPSYFLNDTHGNIYVMQEQQTFRCIFGASSVTFEPTTLMTLPSNIIKRFYWAVGDFSQVPASGRKCVTYPGLEEPEIICYESNSVLVRFFHPKWKCSIARWDGSNLTILTPPFPFHHLKLCIDPAEMMIYAVTMRVGKMHSLHAYRYGVKSLLTLSMEVTQKLPNWQDVAMTLPIELRERFHKN